MIKYSDLNPAQKEAVIDDNPHLRIIAGAGSGKTRVLTMRIAYLIEQKDVDPRHILAITFTNKAAKEMKDRIAEMLKERGAGTFISTIHSLCVRILSEDIGAEPLPVLNCGLSCQYENDDLCFKHSFLLYFHKVILF